MVVLFSTTNGLGILPCPSSFVIFSPYCRLFVDTIRYRLHCKVYGTVVKLSSFNVDSSVTHILYRKDKVDIDLLKVRFSDCLLGISKSITTLAYSRSVSTAQPVQTQGGSPMGTTNF
jgi:hypothetical protein